MSRVTPHPVFLRIEYYRPVHTSDRLVIMVFSRSCKSQNDLRKLDVSNNGTSSISTMVCDTTHQSWSQSQTTTSPSSGGGSPTTTPSPNCAGELIIGGSNQQCVETIESGWFFETCPVSCKGPLSRKSRLTRQWKAADYFELRGSMLIGFTGRVCAPLGVRFGAYSFMYDLAGMGEAVVVSSSKNGYTFSISVDKKTVLLRAPTEECRKMWLACINKARKNVTRQDFTLESVIGEGHFGKVFLARQRGQDGEKALVALKEIKLTRKLVLKHVLKERLLLASLPQHPFVISLKMAFRNGNYIYYGFDFMQGADLFEFVRQNTIRIEAHSAALYSSQIVLALEHLHRYGIIYRDLKPENVLVSSEGHLVLADLGLAKRLPTSGRTYTLCGTRAYFAPEMLKNFLPPHTSKGSGYDFSVDFWQLGCFIYELYKGRSPFMDPKTRDVYNANIFAGECTRPNNMEDSAWDITKALLIPNPENRLGCGGGGWEEVKSHTFFTDIVWQDILRKEFEPPVRPKPAGERYIDNFSKNYTSKTVRWGSEEDIVNLKSTGELFKKELMGFSYVQQ